MEENAVKESDEKRSFEMIVVSPVMKEIISMAKNIAPLNVNILITGETGVGKEELARFIHKLSGKEGEFVIINSASLPESIVESELFGYKKGAFTGAIEDRMGYLKLADRGTLFLDEISDMSPSVQSKILQVVDNRNFCSQKEFYPVGGRTKISSDFRLITTSNCPLEKLIAEKKFREDLFYRLNVIHFHIPPLRERKEEITPLALHFMYKIWQELRIRFSSPSLEALDFLCHYDWPGNVRELKNLILRAMVLNCHKETLEADDLRQLLNNGFYSGKKTIGKLLITAKRRNLVPSKNSDFEKSKIPVEVPALIRQHKRGGRRLDLGKEKIIEALSQNDWSQTKTAKALGIARLTVWKKIKELGILPPSGSWKTSRKNG